ncbi:preprotein translocase subunit YajC [Corynebacterium hylobatis]|uniref:Preprotein translocase subunit YajC n=1 Tax=Corynebacterium hylobatis TaxID=1859290 RepID=A0A3S0BF15_9CORY|nr:preprotein translocase subunit YajC [Corynebacterium hylobatis]RSZ61631.1 preprotein translocase subunit YajC [Corynebacterium hylobatis]
MDLLLLLLILAVFILPSVFMMRSQRKRQAEVQGMQAALKMGDRVVTVSGIHGTIVGVRDTELDIELAPGMVVVMDRIAVLRQAEPSAAPGALGASGYQSTYDASTGTAGTQGYQHPEYPTEHPENFPDNDEGRPENR